MSEEYSVGYSEGYQAGWNAAMDATPPAAPVQEPDHSDELTIAYMSGVHRGKELAAQRQWVGLTDEERDQHRDDWRSNIHDKEFQAIENLLRSKNT